MNVNCQIKIKNNFDSLNEIFYDKPFEHCTRAMPSMKKQGKKKKTLNVLSDITQISSKFWWVFKSKPNKKQRMKISISLKSLR